MSGRRTLQDALLRRMDAVDRMLRLYVDDPGEENIHDVRTSIRRLESAYMIVPGSSKSKSSERHARRLKDFFSMNSRIRDYDITMAKLAGYGHDAGSRHVLALRKRRKKRVSESVGSARRILRARRSPVKVGRKITSKYEKTILRLLAGIRGYMHVVMEDESRMDDLHAMRKMLKRLRYTLELDRDGAHHGLIPTLRGLQVMLGDIHDCDMFVSYAEKTGDPDLSGMITQEKKKRHELYLRLVPLLRSADV